MIEPGFTRSLSEELQRVSPEFQQRVHRAGALSDNELVRMTTRQDADPAMYHPVHPDDASLADWSDVTVADEVAGQRMIQTGQVAFVLLAGGAGTRMGGPKLFAQIPGVGTNMLAWKLMQGGDMPVWIMTSPDMVRVVAHHMKAWALSPKTRGTIFTQFEGYRLTPDNKMSWVTPGVPDLHPLGHGDVGPALIENSVLDDNPGVKWAYVCNVDNVMASPHAGLLGLHQRRSADVTCEVVERRPGDKGGVVAYVNDRLQIAEDWRLPPGFADSAKWYNTNTMIIDINVLKMPMEWRWHRVRKHVDNRIVIQHERLLQQYTEELQTLFVKVPRQVRYHGIKNNEDLEAAGKLLESYRYSG